MARLAPCSAKRTAIACPIPDEPPVTRTFFAFTPGIPPRRSCGSAVGAGCDIAVTMRRAAAAHNSVVRPRHKPDRSAGDRSLRPDGAVDVDVAVAHADLTRAGYEPRPGDGAAPRRVAVAIHCRRLRARSRSAPSGRSDRPQADRSGLSRGRTTLL